MTKTIVIVGTATGLGNCIAKKFAKNDFRVVLMARNADLLKFYEEEFFVEGIDVYTYLVDAGKPDTIIEAFNKVKARFGTPEVLVYNVGIKDTGQSDSVNNGELIRHFKANLASAYHYAQQVVSDKSGYKHGVIVFTDGGLALCPDDQFVFSC